MDGERHILVVDDEAGVRQILQRGLTARGFACQAAEDGLQALDRLERETYAVVLTDIRMPRLDGMELLQRIKAAWPHTEVIIITGVFDLRSGIQAIRDGAYDYVTKPFTLEDVTFAVERALHKRALEAQNRHYQENLEEEVELRTLELLESNQRIQQLFVSILKTLANTLEAKDEYTHGHSERVAARAVQVAAQLALPEADVAQLELAGLLHDIGKIGVRESVLHKPGRLTADEYEHIKTHCELGERILRPVEQFDAVLDPVRHHHERCDGCGYPDGIAGDEISLGSKILGVCDAYDAMTSERPYRPALPIDRAAAELRSGRGTQFDPLVADTFLDILLRDGAAAALR